MADWQNFLSSFGAGTGSTDGTIMGFATNLAGSIAEGAQFGGPVGASLAGASSVIQSLVGSIGKGRKEADVIVPVQNQVGGVLASISDAKDDPATTVPQYLNLYFLTIDTYRRFDAFTRDPRFTDGRASRQARDTIRPLIDGKNDAGGIIRSDGGLLGLLEVKIAAKGGVPPGNVANGGAPYVSTITEYTQSPQIAAAAAAAAAVAPGAPGSGGLVMVGALVAAAKLLGFF